MRGLVPVAAGNALGSAARYAVGTLVVGIIACGGGILRGRSVL